MKDKIVVKYVLGDSRWALHDKYASLRIPKEAKLLKIAVQGDYICAWYLAEDISTTDIITFLAVCTGEDVCMSEDTHQYLDTVLCNTGFVFHIFKLK